MFTTVGVKWSAGIIVAVGMAGSSFASHAVAGERPCAQDGDEKSEGVVVKVGLEQGGVELVEPTFIVRLGESATLTTERDGRRLTVKVTVSRDKESTGAFMTRVGVSERDQELFDGVVVSRSGQVASIRSGDGTKMLQIDVLVTG